ncbi:MAG: hypothetical protein ACE5I3_02280, partial [Phycisphaerae bacterium]
MNRTSGVIGYGLLLVAAAVSHGCRWGDRHTNVKEVSVIDGISALEFDGLNVRVRRAAPGATGLFLVV